jgi:hypothetical protein
MRTKHQISRSTYSELGGICSTFKFESCLNFRQQGRVGSSYLSGTLYFLLQWIMVNQFLVKSLWDCAALNILTLKLRYIHFLQKLKTSRVLSAKCNGELGFCLILVIQQTSRVLSAKCSGELGFCLILVLLVGSLVLRVMVSWGFVWFLCY